MRAGDRFAADVRTFLSYVGATGLPLTDTRRLRLADVREINSRLVEPEELDQRIGERIFRMRTEDKAWRVSFIRLICEAAALVKTRHGRLSLTARGGRVATAWPADAVRQLFRAWWWRGEWGLGGGHGWIDGVRSWQLGRRPYDASAEGMVARLNFSRSAVVCGALLRA